MTTKLAGTQKTGQATGPTLEGLENDLNTVRSLLCRQADRLTQYGDTISANAKESTQNYIGLERRITLLEGNVAHNCPESGEISDVTVSDKAMSPMEVYEAYKAARRQAAIDRKSEEPVAAEDDLRLLRENARLTKSLECSQDRSAELFAENHKLKRQIASNDADSELGAAVRKMPPDCILRRFPDGSPYLWGVRSANNMAYVTGDTAEEALSQYTEEYASYFGAAAITEETKTRAELFAEVKRLKSCLDRQGDMLVVYKGRSDRAEAKLGEANAAFVLLLEGMTR